MAKFLWTQKQDIGPRPRRRYALAFDAPRRRTVLFGGDAFIDGLLNDTWEWDGEIWTQITDLGPSARSWFAMAYDSSRRRTVLFGGINAESHSLGDTWEWDGESWTQVEDSGPAARSRHAMAFDAQRNRVLLFGGDSLNGFVADTWEWDGEGWTQTAEAGPPARADAMLAFDRTRQRLILFGGANEAGLFNDTWGWDGETWTQVADIGPAPCIRAALVSVENRLVLFGGMGRDVQLGRDIVFGNTWEWDGKHWVQRSDFGPGPRAEHAMAYDDANRQLVLFGGMTISTATPDQNPVTVLLGDTWVHVPTPAPPAVNDQPGAGAIESFILEPDHTSINNLFINHGHVTCKVKLTQVEPVDRQITIEAPFDFHEGGTIIIPAGQLFGFGSFTVPPVIVPGEYIIHASLGDEIKSATLTLT